MSVTANLFHISRGSLHDGPGVRSVVYFSGCSLRCRWCHNPEGFSASPQIQYFEQRCIGCGRCSLVCPSHHPIQDGRIVYLRQGCTGCGHCASVCPADALQLTGAPWTPESLVKLLKKDAPYYARSGGGVTFSGGECLLQPAFVREAAALCRREVIHVLVETALHIPQENLAAVLPWIDAFYVDLKHMDPSAHRTYTGADNQRVLSNLQWLAARHTDITVRTPLIPGVNDGMDNLLQTALLAYDLRPAVKGYALLKYNNLAASKYRQLGLPFEGFAAEGQSPAQMRQLCDALNASLGTDHFVFFAN